ncbi:MAG: hypothetical protein ACM3ZC_02130 [Bacteroidota bacterium]
MDQVAEMELEQARERPGLSGGRFWQGVLTGVFSVVLLCSAAGYYLLSVRGLSIFFDQEQLAASVRAKLRARAAEEFPAMVGKVADEATAALLRDEAAPRLTLELSGRRLELPPETAGMMWREFRDVAKATVDATLASFDLSPYANQMADEAYEMVQQTLSEEIYGKTFRFRANRWLSVPVTVRGASRT